MKFAVDFSEVEARSLIPAGQYQAVITNCVLKQKPGKEHPYLSWSATIAEGEYEGRSPIAMTTSFQPDAMWKMMETFQNLGYTEKEFELEFADELDEATGGNQLISPEVINLPCQINVYNDMYNNRQTSKIESILSVEAQPVPVAATAAKPAAKAAPAAKSNGPAPAAAAKRSPFPGAKTGGAVRTFK
jgi:hypothetical protein